MVRLKDGGLAIDWSGLTGIKAWLYSDAQKAISGRFDVSVNQEDHTLLKCDYSATKPQYLGVNRIIIQAKYNGRTKTYDKAIFNFVPRTSDVPGDITIDEPIVDVELEVEDVSSSILDTTLAAMFKALDEVQDIIDIHRGPQGPQGETGPTGPQGPVGPTGATPAFKVGTVTTGEPGTAVVVTITGTAEAPVLNITIPQGMQGNTGSSVDYPFELVNNLETDDATKGLSAAQGAVLDRKINSIGQNYIPRCTFNESGGINGNPEWFIGKDYIPVANGDTIVWNPGINNWGGYLCLYDSDKNFLNNYSANAAERTIVLNNADVAYIRAPFYMDNLASAKIVRNGVTVWEPSDKDKGVLNKVKDLSKDIAYTLGETLVPFITQNGTPGNFQNENYVLLRGANTVTIPGIPGHRYRISISKTPHEGYNFYFRLNTYSNVSPSSFTANRVRAGSDNWNIYYLNGEEFSLNAGEYGITLLLGELTAPSDSSTISPLRESDFSEEDIHIIDITNSAIDGLRYALDTKMSNTVKYSVFSPVKGKYITDREGGKIEASNSGVSYIEIPIDKIDARICLTGFGYTPSSATPETYTSIVFFDSEDTLLSRTYDAINGVMSLEKPENAVSCYVNAPVAHIDELRVYSDTGETEGEGVTATGVLSGYNSTKNLIFGASSLTIAKNGFSYVINGVLYGITGSEDYVFNFYENRTRRYLCLDSSALTPGNNAFSDVLKVFDDTVPGSNYVVLLNTYIGHIQDGLFFGEYLKSRQEADTVGSQLNVDYETKGKVFSALYAAAQDAVSFIFFTDPHTAAGASYAPFGKQMPMLKTIQQFYQSLPLDFVLSGGDWLNNSDTAAQACYKLGNIKQQLKTRLSPCYFMLGNHDTNYQGVALSQDAINTLLFNDFGKSYYRIERHNCALYVFDSGTDGRTTISAYEQEQLAWFAQSLYSEKSPNIIIASHIIVAGSSVEQSTIQPFAEAIEQIAGAYNNRGSVTVNGYEYQFGTATGDGKVRCFIGGHTHYDYINTEQPIPIFITLNAIATSGISEIWGDAVSPRFDMILIDFTEGVLHAVRVGDGSDRTMDLAV